MYAIYVNEPGCIPYARMIAEAYKTLETRSKNVFKQIIGERVAIIRTSRHSQPMVVGYATISRAEFISIEEFQQLFSKHLVPPGSKFDCHGKGKWCYTMTGAEPCDPYPLPISRINHGRSYTEF